MIKIKDLTKKDIGKWVVYNPERKNEIGRIKSWNDKYIFVVYKCNHEWTRFKEFTGVATNPADLFWKDIIDRNPVYGVKPLAKKINWQDQNPIGLTIKLTEADWSEEGKRVRKTGTTYAVWFQGQNYLYPWEIDQFIEGLLAAKEEIIKEKVDRRIRRSSYHGRRLRFAIWLFFHNLYCRFWSWRLPRDLNIQLNTWLRINRKMDKSWSAKDFRFWVYLRKIE